MNMGNKNHPFAAISKMGTTATKSTTLKNRAVQHAMDRAGQTAHLEL
jgi:hypothetical protein